MTSSPRSLGRANDVSNGRYLRGMDMDWNVEIVDQLESHWHHRLRHRLDGLADDEYFWQPVPDCWTINCRGRGGR